MSYQLFNNLCKRQWVKASFIFIRVKSFALDLNDNLK